MDDFIELGIEAVDKCVDKHFHKLPDKALHPETYHPRNIKNAISGRLQGDGPVADESGSDDDRLDEKGYHRQESKGHRSLDGDEGTRLQSTKRGRDGPIEYESDSPRYRDATHAHASPLSHDSSTLQHGRTDNDDIDRVSPLPYSQGHPQQHLRRRSLPYDERISRDMTTQQEFEDTKKYHNNRRRFTVDESRNSSHRRRSKLANKSSDKADSNDAGLRYGAVGAMLGGLAAQELTTKKNRGGHNEKVAFAMLGAVVGALAGKSFGERVHEDKGKTGQKPSEGRYDREYNTKPTY